MTIPPHNLLVFYTQLTPRRYVTIYYSNESCTLPYHACSTQYTFLSNVHCNVAVGLPQRATNEKGEIAEETKLSVAAATWCDPRAGESRLPYEAVCHKQGVSRPHLLILYLVNDM